MVKIEIPFSAYTSHLSQESWGVFGAQSKFCMVSSLPKIRINLLKSLFMPRQNFPGGSGVKHLPANAGDPGLIAGSGRSPGERNGNPLQYSCL